MTMLWIWLASAFVVSLVATIASGVRGAISSFAMGAIAAFAPEILSVVGPLFADARLPTWQFGGIGAAAFRTVYWWMMAFPAAALGIAIRSRLVRRRGTTDGS